jgi:AbrB family looped-hinge helix DNA binding protein
MTVVTTSSKYRVVLPRAARERLGLHSGQRMHALVHGDRLVLRPLRTASALRGFLKGVDSNALRSDAGDRHT